MSNDKYKDFETWYETVKNKQYDFKQEMVKYCRADVELLSKSVLKFRHMFKRKWTLTHLDMLLSLG